MPGKELWDTSNRILGRPHSRSGRFVKEENLFLLRTGSKRSL
jgi:hypothetical protein